MQFLFPLCGQAQLIYRPTEEYENYGFEGYRPYGRTVIDKPTDRMYDPFGNYLGEGVKIYNLSEYKARSPDRGSFLDKNPFYYLYSKRLIIGGDNYKRWSSRLIIGDHIRTKFTSLTLDLASLNGIRWDVSYREKALFTAVASRRDRPMFDQNEGNQPTQIGALASTYLLGGHFESQIGILNLGVTYLNQYRIDAVEGTKGMSIRGVTPVTSLGRTRYIAVKFSDGSDEDGGGAQVFNVRMYINGKLTATKPKVTRHNSEIIDPAYPNVDRYFPGMIAPYVEFLGGKLDFIDYERLPFLEANGKEYLIYWFEIPEYANSVEFDALVANNYVISLSEIHDTRGVTRATFYHTVARSPEDVKDGSNVRQIRFSYGRQTSGMVLGFHANLSARGFRLKSEWVRNLNFFQYPTEHGRYHRDDKSAYYLNLIKDYRILSLGAEYFKVSPGYSTSITVMDPSFTSYTDLPEKLFFGQLGGSFDLTRNNTIILDMVDDNDDKDPYPDSYFIPSQSDRNGVYPGIDRDLDGRPDTDENANGIPDYDEPFLLYSVNPEAFEYGDDLNNNGVIDTWENDDRPDYVYDTNLKGYHGFVELALGSDTDIRVGYYNTRALANGGRNLARYVKLEYFWKAPEFGQLYIANNFRKVEDSIRNDLVDYEDPLLMENSLVNTLFIDSKLFALGNLLLEGSVKYELNWQMNPRGKRYNDITDWASVSRISYNWGKGRLNIVPQLKYMIRRGSDLKNKIYPLHQNFFYPILKAEYALTPNTTLKAGAQGFPFMKSWYHDVLNRNMSYTTEDYVVMLTNMSIYKGYNFSLNTGWHLRIKRFEDRSRESEDEDYSLIFVQLTMGLE